MLTSMLTFIHTIQSHIRVADVLDIAVIASCLYISMLWLKQRAAYSMIIMIAIVAWLYAFAHLLGMNLTLSLFQAGITAILVAIVLIFQQDIRRTIDHLTTWGMFSKRSQPTALSEAIDVLVETLSILAANKIGALVVTRGQESLERHIRGGVIVNGRISLPLLYSIFHPASPGHDGAVILEGIQIERLGVHLPLSANLQQVGTAGTRHAAALGMAECSDALVLVVSEERGTLSVAEEGKLEVVTASADLKERLQRFYARILPASPQAKRRVWFTSHLGSKLAAAVVATLLWTLFAYNIETIERTLPIKVQTAGTLPKRLRLVALDTQPKAIRTLLLVQKPGWGGINEVYTKPLDLSDIGQSTTLRMPLSLPPQAKLPSGAEPFVTVRVGVAARAHQ